MGSHDSVVEHFFRHEYGRIVALLVRTLGVRSVDLVEDSVQQAMFRALSAWRAKGVPADASAWLYRTAKNIAIDALRRNKHEVSNAEHCHEGGLEFILESETSRDESFDASIPDESLRLLFLACHPDLPLESTLALALKLVSGFGTGEIAAALLISKANAEKRIARAKEKLRQYGRELGDVDQSMSEDRIAAVQATIYLIFSEGFASSVGPFPMRVDLCDEAIRLIRLLVAQCPVSTATSSALLALMLFHSARLNSRMDNHGAIVDLENQDRKAWDWDRIREGMAWMERSAMGTELSRYHIEAAIAWEHCRASEFATIDWRGVCRLYEMLLARFPGPMVRLNHAIALGYFHGPEFGLKRLASMPAEERAKLRPWWDCAMANAYRRLDQVQSAIGHYSDAIALATNQEQRDWIADQIETLQRT